jgi:hypothetical protein
LAKGRDRQQQGEEHEHGSPNEAAASLLESFHRVSSRRLLDKVIISSREPGYEQKGADLTRPASRHREAPFHKARQAAPTWAQLRWYMKGLAKIRGFRCSP